VLVGQGNSVLENHHWSCLVGFLKSSHLCDHFTTEEWSVVVTVHVCSDCLKFLSSVGDSECFKDRIESNSRLCYYFVYANKLVFFPDYIPLVVAINSPSYLKLTTFLLFFYDQVKTAVAYKDADTSDWHLQAAGDSSKITGMPCFMSLFDNTTKLFHAVVHSAALKCLQVMCVDASCGLLLLCHCTQISTVINGRRWSVRSWCIVILCAWDI